MINDGVMPLLPVFPCNPCVPLGMPKFMIWLVDVPVFVIVASDDDGNVETVPTVIVGETPSAPLIPTHSNIKSQFASLFSISAYIIFPKFFILA